MSLPAVPPPELIEKAASVPIHYVDTSRRLRPITDAEHLLTEIWPEFLDRMAEKLALMEQRARHAEAANEQHMIERRALAVTQHDSEQQLRQTIADEIEVFADNFDTERGEDEWPIGDGYWSGLRRAATIARGRVSS